MDRLFFTHHMISPSQVMNLHVECVPVVGATGMLDNVGMRWHIDTYIKRPSWF